MIAAIETLIPVFAIIALGAALKRIGMLSDEQWQGIEELMYSASIPRFLNFSIVPIV